MLPTGMQDGADHTQRVTYTFLIGVYLAVNAIRDLYLLVEGPDCTHMKTQYVQGNHDWLSTLTSVSGMHRIANTALHPAQMTASRERALRDKLLRIASEPAVPAVALTSMPMAFITGADYDRLTREVSRETGKPVFQIPGKSLSGDWLDGYEESLVAIARGLNLSGGEKRGDRIGIVGYLWDRNEDDHGANIRELRRLLADMGLELSSVWLSGDRFADLAAIREAGTVVSMPYGRRAARLVAKKTGAKLLELPLPFGMDATERWLRAIGDATGTSERVSGVVERELSQMVPKLEWVVPFVFQNRVIDYVGDPHLLVGLEEIVRGLGATLGHAIVTNRPAHARSLVGQVGYDMVVYPKMRQMARLRRERHQAEQTHLVVTNNAGLMGTDGAVLEFGFPSYFRHALHDRPFLGMQGLSRSCHRWRRPFDGTRSNRLDECGRRLCCSASRRRRLASEP